MATVAIVSDNPLQRHRLQQAVGKLGLTVRFIGDPARYLEQDGDLCADLWIVDLDDENTQPKLLDDLLADESRTLLFGLGTAPEPGKVEYARWERRLFGKLQDQLGELEKLDDASTLEALEQTPESRRGPPCRVPLSSWITPAGRDQAAEQVWILGASLGGPAAVKAFLDTLPAGLPIAFVYAQHIDHNFTGVLTRVLGRHAQYALVEAQQGQALHCGEVVFVPVDRVLCLDEEGRIDFRPGPWPGPYGPSIDQVMLNIADRFQGRCHTIVFSGMGNDGAVAAPLLKAYGSRVWVQESGSCANSAMPDSVAATGCSEFAGTPEELAQRLVKQVEEHELLARKHRRDSASGPRPCP